MPYHAKIIAQSRHTGFSAALLATMAPCFIRRPRRTEARPAPQSTLHVFAAFKRLGWCVAGPDGASATASFRNDGLTRPDWRAGAPAWGLEPALALVTHRERRRLQTTLYLTVRVPASTERQIVDASASPAIGLMHGEALSPPSPWHALRRRFLDPTGFVDRPSLYATAVPTPPISQGLPGDWDPPRARWAQYERRMREMVEGASDLATGRKRPRVRPGHGADQAPTIAVGQRDRGSGVGVYGVANGRLAP